ncbi:MAG: transcriptional regulator [Hyphomicrobiales bacterium]|nr:MAG: transcriptional regulator [Hyphomicrobiales bacterium]
MQRTAAQPAIEAERERAQRAQYAKLTAHYGKIGSAALNAALLCAKRKKAKTLTKPA